MKNQRLKMNSFKDDDCYTSGLKTLNNISEFEKIDFESLLQLFDNTSPLFDTQTNDLSESQVKLLKQEPECQLSFYDASINRDLNSNIQSSPELSDYETKFHHVDKNNDSCNTETIKPKKKTNCKAASKYRLKKNNEKDKLFEARDYLEKQNSDIKREIEHVKTEIDYLKTLIIQMLMYKGIINPSGKIVNS